MDNYVLTQQEQAANIPLTSSDISKFQAIWHELTGEMITCQAAAEHGRRLLALYKYVYRPLTEKQYQQLFVISPKEKKDE